MNDFTKEKLDELKFLLNPEPKYDAKNLLWTIYNNELMAFYAERIFHGKKEYVYESPYHKECCYLFFNESEVFSIPRDALQAKINYWNKQLEKYDNGQLLINEK